MKRLLTMLLSAALLVSAFAGCGGEGKESSATSGETAGGSSSNQASTEETDWSSQEPYTVKLLIPGDAKTEDVEEVSAAASKILEEKYNTTLEIMRVGFGSYPDQVNLMLSSGEKLDGGAMTVWNTSDDLGGDIGSLLDCTNPDDTTVINWYASDEYKEIVERRYEWVKKGLIPPDASSSSDQAATQIAAGRGFGQFCNTKPGIEVEHQRSTTKEMLVFTLTPVYTTTTRVDILWYIAHNSTQPGRAIQVLNELYINPELANICINGIEGKHYELIDEEQGIIAYPEGVDGTTTGYTSNPWAWPNEMISYVWDGDSPTIWEDTTAWNDSAIVSPAMGFTWDNANVLNEVTAVRNVRGKYANALECGSIDPAEALPAFLEELETAGANTIIEEKQKQLDEYLASKE